MSQYIGSFHVIPVHDMKEHDNSGDECWCGAMDDGEVVIHNASDILEQFESLH